MRILVTGAAGLIGGEVCARLAARGHDITAMVRRTKEVRGNDGADVPVASVVSGDVTLPLMELDPARHALDLVVHCAASLQFDAPEEELERDNVQGTANALAFAKACGAKFAHVSTAYVCGLRQGVIEEGPVPEGTQFANNYEASKARAEALVAASGVPFAIARPSITLGHSETGAIRDFPSLCNVFRLMARGKITTFPADPNSTLDLVPIDHVAEGIARISERMDEAQGGYFHLVAATPTPSAELAHGVARVPHFPDPQIVAPADFDLASLSPMEARVAGRMLATFGSYFTRSPRFDDRKLRALTGLTCPPTDSEWMDRLIAYGMAAGYLPAPPVSARPDSDARAAPAHP
ncbi:SDR family oxidoreductase [Alteraurantiacibacter aquimixticola]|uniref:SDR family oxidoreductase n=1 Tax=Alteraurantiacibacter aquimixticola TaxID=2489173 RepID=UPI001FE94C94|nr:SDR family oxidoreductase [Alteraurantiacibacter aquimixticola]